MRCINAELEDALEGFTIGAQIHAASQILSESCQARPWNKAETEEVKLRLRAIISTAPASCGDGAAEQVALTCLWVCRELIGNPEPGHEAK